MDYTLVRSDRRTLSVGLNNDGRVTVRAPFFMPLTQIERFLTQKQGWIEKKRAQIRSRAAERPCLLAVSGETLPLLGRDVTIQLTAEKAPRLLGDTLFLPQTGALQALDRFVTRFAQAELPPRARLIASQLSIYPASVSVSGARTRWGSMSGQGAMRLSRCLVFCPEDVIEYVIVHELCHILHPDHSAAFWRSVESRMPDFREKRAWLKRSARLTQILPVIKKGARKA